MLSGNVTEILDNDKREHCRLREDYGVQQLFSGHAQEASEMGCFSACSSIFVHERFTLKT